MTYERLKSLTAGLLTGDNVLPLDDDSLLGLIEMGLSEIATHADAFHLMTLNRNADVVRLGIGNYIIRYPSLPSDGDDVVDIDNELCFPLARLMASYVSDKKSAIHYSEARRLMREYNSKVYEILETMKEQKDGTYDTKPTNYSA